MTISRRERIAVACMGVLLFMLAGIWSSQYAISAPAIRLVTVPHASSSTAATNVRQITRLDSLHGLIFNPWEAQPQDGVVSASAATRFGGKLPSGVPANPMGFDTTHVPGMFDPGGGVSNSLPTQTVYALGTNYAILVQGGPLIHRGSVINGVAVEHIDSGGVYLSDGEVLRLARESSGAPQAAYTAPLIGQHIGASGSSSNASAPVTATPTPTPAPTSTHATYSTPAAPAASNTSSPTLGSAIDAALRQRLKQLKGGGTPQTHTRGVR